MDLLSNETLCRGPVFPDRHFLWTNLCRINGRRTVRVNGESLKSAGRCRYTNQRRAERSDVLFDGPCPGQQAGTSFLPKAFRPSRHHFQEPVHAVQKGTQRICRHGGSGGSSIPSPFGRGLPDSQGPEGHPHLGEHDTQHGPPDPDPIHRETCEERILPGLFYQALEKTPGVAVCWSFFTQIKERFSVGRRGQLADRPIVPFLARVYR